METDRKHLLEKNLARFDQYSSVDSGNSYEFNRDTLSEQLVRIENDTDAPNRFSRIFDNLIDVMKITAVLDDVRSNERSDFPTFCSFLRKSDVSYSCGDLFIGDDGYPRLHELFNNLASSNLSPAEPMTCSLERSNSWQFRSFSSNCASINNFSCSSSTSSSVCSLTQFNQILRTLQFLHDDDDAIGRTNATYIDLRRFSTIECRRRKLVSVKRSYSDSDLRTLDDWLQISTIPKPNDVRLQNIGTRCIDDAELDSDDEYIACKRPKIDISSVSLTSTNNTE